MTKQDHARAVGMFRYDLNIIHRGDTDIIVDLYESDKMNDHARAAFEALLALAND